MAWLLDTSVLIPIRDGNPEALVQLGKLRGPLFASVISIVELEGGVWRLADDISHRRDGLAAIRRFVITLPFEPRHAELYGKVVAHAGYSRRKMLDRMIGVQALAVDAFLVTLNPTDFSDIDGLKVLAW